jgi:hypothetical protein
MTVATRLFREELGELKNWASIGVVHPSDLEVVIAQIAQAVEW